MATYLEIQSLEESPDASNLRNRIKVALSKSAQGILENPNATADQRGLASEILDSPQRFELRALRFVAVKFGIQTAPAVSLTLAQLVAAGDADVQVGVQSVVNAYVGTIV